MRRFSIYKGLEKPLCYKGFKGKFIYYGIGSLAAALVLGGLSGALINMYAGGFITVASVAGGLCYTLMQQKKGLHSKDRSFGIFIYPNRLKIRYEKQKTLI